MMAHDRAFPFLTRGLQQQTSSISTVQSRAQIDRGGTSIQAMKNKIISQSTSTTQKVKNAMTYGPPPVPPRALFRGTRF